jgi:hypothetical protein
MEMAEYVPGGENGPPQTLDDLILDGKLYAIDCLDVGAPDDDPSPILLGLQDDGKPVSLPVPGPIEALTKLFGQMSANWIRELGITKMVYVTAVWMIDVRDMAAEEIVALSKDDRAIADKDASREAIILSAQEAKQPGSVEVAYIERHEDESPTLEPWVPIPPEAVRGEPHVWDLFQKALDDAASGVRPPTAGRLRRRTSW